MMATIVFATKPAGTTGFGGAVWATGGRRRRSERLFRQFHDGAGAGLDARELGNDASSNVGYEVQIRLGLDVT